MLFDTGLLFDISLIGSVFDLNVHVKFDLEAGVRHLPGQLYQPAVNVIIMREIAVHFGGSQLEQSALCVRQHKF